MRRNWLVGLASLLALGGLIAGIRAGALWDPHEVTVAELARRIALNLLGGASLAIPGADNGVPIRADLGRGELPFTSAALGFRVFGLSDWAGRLPLALWAVIGVASVHAAAARLWNRRVALYGVDRLIAAKQDEKNRLDAAHSTDEIIRDREELSEQIRALKELKKMAASTP